MKPRKASGIVIACAVLFNLSILWNEPPDNEDQCNEDQPPIEPYHGSNDGSGFRNYIANTYFI